MNTLADDELIDRIYEAAVVPELWPPVLDRLAYRVEAAGTFLFLLANNKNLGWVCSEAIREVVEGWIAGNWQAKTQRAPRMIALNHAGFVAECDVYGPGELEQDEAVVQYLRPAGWGYGAGTWVPMPTGEVAVFSIERRFETGPMNRQDCVRLDPLRPHLARAALLSARIGLERARAMTLTLEELGIPGAIIRSRGALLTANPMFERLMPAVVQDRSDRVYLTNPNADRLLATALDALRGSAPHPTVTSIPIPAMAAQPPMIVHLLPVRGAAHDFFLKASVIIMLTPIDRGQVPGVEVLQGLFDLSPAEARVAHGIGTAQSLDALATSLGVSRETVRSQLKAVLAKTGLTRQQELVGLLAGKAAPSGKPLL
jgi:DNA-binding CsgD family transcriptional regulator